MLDEELKKLSPEERRKRLKGLEEQKKKEIEEAQKMLRETEKELSDEAEWKRKVPIPQVAMEDISGLSEAEKEIVKAHRGARGKKEEEEEGKKTALPAHQPTRELSLEEAVFRERMELPPEVIGSDYAERLSRRPMEDLAQEVKNVYQAVGDKGYISAEEERRIQYLGAATERKLEDIEAGRYSLTEEVAEAALLTKQMGGSLMDQYRREGRKGGNYQR